MPLRGAIGNRIYGCDDCQLACPWNRFAGPATLTDFAARHALDEASLVDLFGWSRARFEDRMAGSAILRIGYERWLRNIAVALGNAAADERGQGAQASDDACARADRGGSERILAALEARSDDPSPLVREHVAWAIARHRGRGASGH